MTPKSSMLYYVMFCHYLWAHWHSSTIQKEKTDPVTELWFLASSIDPFTANVIKYVRAHFGNVCNCVAWSTRDNDDFGVYSRHLTGKWTIRPMIHSYTIQSYLSSITGSVCLCNTQVFSGCSQCLKPQNGEDEVHANFAKLLSEINKADAPYALNIANRLYGEQSYQFVEVCIC